MVAGKEKLEAYIKYREDRDKAILLCFQKRDELTREELFDMIYGGRGLTGDLVVAARNNLDLHLAKLIHDH